MRKKCESLVFGWLSTTEQGGIASAEPSFQLRGKAHPAVPSSWMVAPRLLRGLRLTYVLLIGALALLWPSASQSQSEAGSGQVPLHLFSPLRTDSTPIHVRLAGRDYYIPANYFDSLLEPGLDQRDVLLVALWPSLEARTRENWDEFMKVPGWGRRVTLLIKVLKRPETALDAQLRTAEYMSGPFEAVGIEHGLQRSVPVGEGRFGKRREVFIARDSEQATAVIECTRDGDYPKPGCEHHFLASRLFVKALYDKRYLPEWQSIQDSVVALLERFQQAPPGTTSESSNN